MREMHRDHSEAGEQEGDQQRDAVRVVEAGEQHHQHQRREREAGARRQDVDAARADDDGQPVVALAPAGPGAHAAAQIFLEGAGNFTRRGRHGRSYTGTGTPRLSSAMNAA